MSKIHSPRKGSLGFSFKRAKSSTVPGGKEHALWFHKVGMSHTIDRTEYIPFTCLELPDTVIKTYYEYTATERIELNAHAAKEKSDKTHIRTLLEIKPKFQKTSIYREIGYIESIEELIAKFKNATCVKVQSVTKGKGFEGPVKRRGIKLGKRKRARTDKQRHIGAIGGRTGHTTWRAPQPGNLGFGTRTYKGTLVDVPYNTTIPYRHYGYITKDICFAARGSVPGNVKALVKIYVR